MILIFYPCSMSFILLQERTAQNQGHQAMVKSLVHKVPLEAPSALNVLRDSRLLRTPSPMLNVCLINDGVTLCHLAKVCDIYIRYYKALRVIRPTATHILSKILI